MKHTYSGLILLLTTVLFSCRKEGNDIDIKTYDQQQIEAYIRSNNLTSMKRDLTDGDTTGIYYEIIGQGANTPENVLNYDTRISFVYSAKSLDGKFVQADTILNHSYSFVGRLLDNTGSALLPKGLMLAIHNLAKYKGTRAKFIIPSRLAYGRSGSGTGDGRLPGNQSLEYYVNIINNQADYDDQVISKYLTANNLTGYTKLPAGDPFAGLYYKVTQKGTGTETILPTSTVVTQFTGRYLNGPYLNQTIFSEANDASGYTSVVQDNIPGFAAALQKGTAGGKLSFFIPSRYAYGTNGSANQSTGALSIPANMILHFEINLLTVTN